MAVKLNQQFQLDLGALIQSSLDSFAQTRREIQGKKEADFQSAVTNTGMSLQDQLTYRKAQLEEEKKASTPDQDFLATLKTNITSLTKLVRFDKAKKDYFAAYNDFKTGKSNIENVINVLQDQLTGALTPEEYDAITGELNSAISEKAQIDSDILTNRITLAKNDGTETVLNSAIDEVKTRIAKAQAAGNKGDVEKWNVQLQGLNQTLNTTKTTLAAHDLDLRIGREALTAAAKLEAINQQISKSDAFSPITVAGVKYNSAQEYWSMQRNDYLAGNGSGNFKDYFSEYQNEVKDQRDAVASISKFGVIPVSKIDQIDQSYKNLLNKDEFRPFLDKINNERNIVVSNLVNQSAKAIVNEAESFGNFDQAEQALTQLQTKYAIDMTANLVDLGKKRLANVEKYRTTQNLAESGLPKEQLSELNKSLSVPAEPGVSKDIIAPPVKLTPQQEADSAVANDKISPEAQAIRAGKAPTVPATTPTPTPTPSVISTQPATPATTTPAPAPKIYVVKKGDTLSSISQTNLGNAKRYGEIATLNSISDPNKISVGQQIKLPSQ